MQDSSEYAFQTTTQLTQEAAIEKVSELLAGQGFGVLTEIDIAATLKKKLDLDYKPYRILGACNPSFAHQALKAEHLIGVLLPCNVVVWDEGDYRVIAMMNPGIMAKVSDNPVIKNVADEVSNRLQTVMRQFEKE